MGVEVNGIDLADEYKKVRAHLGTLLCHCNNVIESAGKAEKTNFDKGYDCGIEEMYMIFKKILCRAEEGGMKWSDIRNVFGTDNIPCILNNNSAKEIISKVKESEGKFLLGDIVAMKTNEHEKYWVNGIGVDNGYFSGIALSSGYVPIGASVDGLLIEDFKKTGEHCDLNCITKAVE